MADEDASAPRPELARRIAAVRRSLRRWVRLEMAQLYAEAKHGRRNVQGGELESRVKQLEKLLTERPT